VTIRPLHRAIVLALSAPLLVAACGGGGAVVRNSAPSASLPPTTPPPASAPTSPCPAPVTTTCTIVDSHQLPGGRQSAYALVIGNQTTAGELDLWIGDDSRFDGGTRVENGLLRLSGGSVRTGASPPYEGTVLRSNIFVGERGTLGVLSGGSRGGVLEGNVENRGTFQLYGTVLGNVANHGSALLAGRLGGNMVNAGRLEVGNAFNGASPNRIDGDFSQSGSGVLRSLLPAGGEWAGVHSTVLSIGGQASLDGTLELVRAIYNDYGAWYGYIAAPLPNAPLSLQILHADGGISGTFRDWRADSWKDEKDVARPLFITGSLRYGSNDVWFDLTRISLESAMTAQGAAASVLASAESLDRAFAAAGGAGRTPSQARFLTSAGRLLWLTDAAQATRSLDSLAGAEHAELATGIQDRAVDAAGRIAMQAATRATGTPAHWTMALADGAVEGFDRWLTPRTLIGGSAAQAAAANADDRRASLYLHRRGEHWQGTVVATAGRSQAMLQRRIDLGDGEAHVAAARRRDHLVQLHAELAKPLELGHGSLQPFAAMDAGRSGIGSFVEQGDTGLELVSHGGSRFRLDAVVGLRYAHDWRFGGQRVSLMAGMQRSRAMHAVGDWQAAFLGVPEATFDLRDWSGADATSAQLSLQGHTANGWQWTFGGRHDTREGGAASWRLQFGRGL